MQERQGAPRGAQLLIAVAGTLAGHALAYRIDSSHLHADGVAHVHAHSWLPWVAAIVAPLALLALGRLALAELRSGARLISLAQLLRWQVVLFAGQEAIERMTAGGNPLTLLAAPVLWYGIVAQVATAGLLLGLVRGAQRVAAQGWVLARGYRIVLPTAIPPRAGTAAATPLPRFHSVGSRGPPPLPALSTAG